MKLNPRRRRRGSPLPVAAALAAVVAVIAAPTVAAAPGRLVDMGDQCRAEYPADSTFLPAEAYLVAPRDAYSWRCKRISISPKGGIVTDLAVDPNGFCTRHNLGHAVVSAVPPNWECLA